MLLGFHERINVRKSFRIVQKKIVKSECKNQIKYYSFPFFRSSNYYDPGSAFRNPGNSFEPSTTSVPRDPFKQNLNSFKYEPYPTNNNRYVLCESV